MDVVERVRWQLHGRKASGPTCEWCEAIARHYEAEYGIDHDASSDLLRFADEGRASCRGALHVDREAFLRVATYLDTTRWPDWIAFAPLSRKGEAR